MALSAIAETQVDYVASLEQIGRLMSDWGSLRSIAGIQTEK
jgi:hypothetical protein